MQTPFIGETWTHWCRLQVRSFYHKALGKRLGTTRVDPPWMLTTLPTKHQTSSHNWTHPTTHCSPIRPPVTQQKKLHNRNRSKKMKRWKGENNLMVSKPFQLSPIFGHISEYAWVALKWVKIEGEVYLQWKGGTFSGTVKDSGGGGG